MFVIAFSFVVYVFFVLLLILPPNKNGWFWPPNDTLYFNGERLDSSNRKIQDLINNSSNLFYCFVHED